MKDQDWIVMTAPTRRTCRWSRMIAAAERPRRATQSVIASRGIGSTSAIAVVIRRIGKQASLRTRAYAKDIMKAPYNEPLPKDLVREIAEHRPNS